MNYLFPTEFFPIIFIDELDFDQFIILKRCFEARKSCFLCYSLRLQIFEVLHFEFSYFGLINREKMSL